MSNSDTPTIAKISATVSGGADYSPIGLKFVMDVNTVPTVTANIADASTGTHVKTPVSGDVLDRIAGLQASRLAGRTETDFKVHADDGRGGSISYDGFISAPILEITKVSTTDEFSSVGRAAMLDALDLSIYNAGYSVARKEVAGESTPGIQAAESGDVPAVIAAVTESLVESYDRAVADEYMAVSKQMLGIQHSINNSGPLEIWQKILSDSNVTYESWDAAFEKCPPIARSLAERVKDMLKSPTPGFWNKVRTLMASFQMYYVPSFDGVGRFERADKKVDEAEDSISASVSGLSVADGSPRILQPGGVVMMMTATPTERREAQAEPSIPRVVAYAPDPLRQGFIQRESPPFWLMRGVGVPVFGSEVEEAPAAEEEDKVNLSLKDRKLRHEKGLEYKEEVDTVSEGVMTELCEVIFKEIQLAHSTAGLTLPLDFSLNDKVGKRATINIKGKGGGSFTAFVSGIMHSVDLRAGKELNSFTRIKLSHAEF